MTLVCDVVVDVQRVPWRTTRLARAIGAGLVHVLCAGHLVANDAVPGFAVVGLSAPRGGVLLLRPMRGRAAAGGARARWTHVAGRASPRELRQAVSAHALSQRDNVSHLVVRVGVARVRIHTNEGVVDAARQRHRGVRVEDEEVGVGARQAGRPYGSPPDVDRRDGERLVQQWQNAVVPAVVVETVVFAEQTEAVVEDCCGACTGRGLPRRGARTPSAFGVDALRAAELAGRLERWVGGRHARRGRRWRLRRS